MQPHLKALKLSQTNRSKRWSDTSRSSIGPCHGRSSIVNTLQELWDTLVGGAVHVRSSPLSCARRKSRQSVVHGGVQGLHLRTGTGLELRHLNTARAAALEEQRLVQCWLGHYIGQTVQRRAQAQGLTAGSLLTAAALQLAMGIEAVVAATAMPATANPRLSPFHDSCELWQAVSGAMLLPGAAVVLKYACMQTAPA